MRAPLSHGAQTSQLSAFSTFENLPSAHAAHARSDEALGAAASCSPGTHVVAFAYGCFSELMQKCLSGHASHTPVLLLPYLPAGHAVQPPDQDMSEAEALSQQQPPAPMPEAAAPPEAAPAAPAETPGHRMTHRGPGGGPWDPARRPRTSAQHSKGLPE